MDKSILLEITYKLLSFCVNVIDACWCDGHKTRQITLLSINCCIICIDLLHNVTF